ncbi:hypothetical protein BUALT_Bualt09G0108600 [Buddleja alternifolia]|uniref:SHSP domain-containing protein n=1 Tax=Buddleja alternifolia TaxID=168488 RepID=A0AAV6X240_9LAMI|nr:hypothetical protein BUALT_Bualt09G0108600 [Buddleja alternifolia]
MKKLERIDSLTLHRKSKRNQLEHPIICPKFIFGTSINEPRNTSLHKNTFNKQFIMERKANQALAYEEFEPLCKWQRNKDFDVLEIHLQGFKKEQLKVQISNYGILKISGERPLDASRKSKFFKEISISSTYEASAIHAKFLNGWLHITMPKRKTLVPENGGKESPEASKIDRSSKPEPSDQSRAPPKSGGAKEQIQTSGGNSSAVRGLQGWKRAAPSLKLAAAAAALAALIAFVVYVYNFKIGDEYCLSL